MADLHMCAQTIPGEELDLTISKSWGCGDYSCEDKPHNAHLVSLPLAGVALLVLTCVSTAWLSPLLYVAAVVTRRKLRRDILGESNTGSNLCSVSKSRASEE